MNVYWTSFVQRTIGTNTTKNGPMKPQGFSYIAAESVNGTKTLENSLPLLLMLKIYPVTQPFHSWVSILENPCTCARREVSENVTQHCSLQHPNLKQPKGSSTFEWINVFQCLYWNTIHQWKIAPDTTYKYVDECHKPDVEWKIQTGKNSALMSWFQEYEVQNQT